MAQPKPVLLMTRPRAASERFAADLPEPLRKNLEVVIAPLAEIVPCVDHVDLAAGESVIFTSSNAVATARLLGANGGRPAFSVGRATTEAAHAAGWQAVFVGETADDLVRKLSVQKPDRPLMHLRGVHARGNIAARLREVGWEMHEQAIYDQVLQPLSPEGQQAIEGQAPVIAPLFSPRMARHFARLTSTAGTIHVAAMSPAVAAELMDKGFASVIVSERPDARNMVRSIETCVQRLSRVERNRGAQ